MDPGALSRRSKKDAASNAAAQAEFNEKRRVWVPDNTEGFLPGWVKSQSGDTSDQEATAEVVISISGETRTVPLYALSPMNPPQFDGVEDIADLTHLNEASVINNLKMRYGAGDIYTYSGLFLISLNPYRNLPIYTPRIVAQYRTKRREENPPHIYAVAERAWQQIGEERESQSILITGESGAGKTENTKKVIQYLAAIASATVPSEAETSSSGLQRSKSISQAPALGLPRSSSYKGKEAEEIDLASIASSSGPVALGLLEQQILQANPILEAFGNAQTMRNNNSSRFGKFIRIFFSHSGAIAGANIDWYLLEKSRVTARAEGERSFHVFYQLLKGAKEAGFSKSLLLEQGPEYFDFLKKTRLHIDGVDDLAEWRVLKDALRVVGFSEAEQLQLFRIPAVILHIGNIVLTGNGSDQALIPAEAQTAVDKVCHLLGIDVTDFSKTVLRPKVRAGREWVTQARTKKQAEDELAALCKFMYEKNFGRMVDRINTALDRPSAKSLSIGVLDIAGFEIFVENSYEQLLINFTNEKLQQFFNFHMFTLEQEEYAREGIEWDYVNFGLDLQPTIELIESSQPVGILAVLDEECIMPKASDTTFTEKVHQYWEPARGASPTHPGCAKFKSTRFAQGFIVKHYAGDVEYRTTGWLEKNKDPINEPLAKLLSQSEVPAIATLFAEYAEDAAATGVHKKVKRGAFRTVGQRHKEQLGQLMTQLASTQPHFVRCIVPNSDKKPGRVEVNLVLDQLRCNGVLEGIRIARLGYPNRHSFSEFRQRYEVLTPGVIPSGYMDGRKAAERIAEALDLDKDFYKIGATKIFFKSGVLAELEERRDNLLTDLFRRFQSAARMSVARRRFKKLLNRAQAIQKIQHNARIYLQLRDWPWWSLYVKVRPLLAATKTDSALVKKQAELAMAKERAERDQEEKRRLEELKVTLLAEKTQVERDLVSERELARDKDLMLERSKGREAELLEKIAELEDDLTTLDGEREEAVLAAETAKLSLAKLQNEMEQLVTQAGLLEKQSAAWRQREAGLLSESKDRASAHSKLENERMEMTRLLDNLKRELGQKEEAMKRAKERGDMNAAELEKRLQLEKGKSTSTNSQISDLTEDLRKARLQQDELKQIIKRHESTLADNQRDIAGLETQRTSAAKAKEALDQEKTALTFKIEALNQELSTRDKERVKDASLRQKLESELDDLRKVMAAKSSEDIKRQEADKSREAEMTRLRQQVGQVQAELDAQRKKEQQLVSKVREEVEGLRQRHTTTDKELKAARAELANKETKLEQLRLAVNKAEEVKRHVDAELSAATAKLSSTETKLQTVTRNRDELETTLSKAQEDYNALEDAVLDIESEKAEWAGRMESISRQLTQESAKRQHFEQQLHAQQVELSELRNLASEVERELAKAEGDIKTRDAEIELLRSRENKTIVEHVYVLENAKKIAERETASQISENSRLNKILKGLEATKFRLQSELDDAKKQVTELKSTRSKQVRAARASLSNEEKDTSHLLEDATRARQVAEARAAGLDRDLQELRKKMSTTHLSPSRPSAAEMKYARMEDEINRFHQEHEALLARNKQLEGELLELRHRPAAGPSTPNGHGHNSNRADLLRGLQQSHDALGRDMSDQLRRLETPLTPSRKQSSLRNGSSDQNLDPSLDLHASKAVRTLEKEVDGLRRQLELEKGERDSVNTQLRQWQTGAEKSGKSFPYDLAGYGQVKTEVMSLRSKLDGWLERGDINDVLGLKEALSHFERDGRR